MTDVMVFIDQLKVSRDFYDLLAQNHLISNFNRIQSRM